MIYQSTNLKAWYHMPNWDISSWFGPWFKYPHLRNLQIRYITVILVPLGRHLRNPVHFFSCYLVIANTLISAPHDNLPSLCMWGIERQSEQYWDDEDGLSGLRVFMGFLLCAVGVVSSAVARIHLIISSCCNFLRTIVCRTAARPKSYRV